MEEKNELTSYEIIEKVRAEQDFKLSKLSDKEIEDEYLFDRKKAEYFIKKHNG